MGKTGFVLRRTSKKQNSIRKYYFLFFISYWRLTAPFLCDQGRADGCFFEIFGFFVTCPNPTELFYFWFTILVHTNSFLFLFQSTCPYKLFFVLWIFWFRILVHTNSFLFLFYNACPYKLFFIFLLNFFYNTVQYKLFF